MRRKSVVQAGAKSQLGGTNQGFSSPAYHPWIAGMVKTEPSRPAAWGMASDTASLTILCEFIYIIYRFDINPHGDVMKDFPVPRIFVSRCLGFDSCRYNGAMIDDDFIQKLRPFVEITTRCPEVEIGLGVPRDPIRVVRSGESLRLFQPATGRDVSEDMDRFSKEFLSALRDIDGFILKNRSPSCGINDVRIFSEGKDSRPGPRSNPGFFGRHVLKMFPHAAVEDEGRLRSYSIRDHFLTRLFTLRGFREAVLKEDISELVDFHSRNKLLLKAYSQKELQLMGRLMASPDRDNPGRTAELYLESLSRTLSKPPSRERKVNTLISAAGFFKKELSPGEKSHFGKLMDKYMDGKIPLSTPAAVIQSWALRFGNSYLACQTFFCPYPEELQELESPCRINDKPERQ